VDVGHSNLDVDINTDSMVAYVGTSPIVAAIDHEILSAIGADHVPVKRHIAASYATEMKSLGYTRMADVDEALRRNSKLVPTVAVSFMKAPPVVDSSTPFTDGISIYYLFLVEVFQLDYANTKNILRMNDYNPEHFLSFPGHLDLAIARRDAADGSR
jgi:hypothetical protein